MEKLFNDLSYHLGTEQLTWNTPPTLPYPTLLSLSGSLVTKTAWLACLGVSSGHWCSKAHLLLPAGLAQHPSSHLLATTQGPLNGMLGSEHVPPLHHRGKPAITLHLRLLFWISNMVIHRDRQHMACGAAPQSSKARQGQCRVADPLQWTTMSTAV